VPDAVSGHMAFSLRYRKVSEGGGQAAAGRGAPALWQYPGKPVVFATLAEGQQALMHVQTSRLHFFDPDTGAAIRGWAVPGQTLRPGCTHAAGVTPFH
jgi:hypothetical protein